MSELAKARVLLIGDDAVLCEFLQGVLIRDGFAVVLARSPERALELLTQEDFDVAVSDLNISGFDGLAFTQRILDQRAELPVILITGTATLELAIGALRLGAWDFLTKPIDPQLLLVSMERARAHQALKAEVQRLRQLVPTPRSDKIVGTSAPMRRIYDLVDRVAPGEAAVLICGESGTGKELVANAVHLGSARKKGPFVAINCAAVPATLLESELFGHTRGAFTDARADRKGLFVQAEGGTLFLDEIAELPLELQPKLLRALQERRVRPLGSSSEVPFNARLITATNRDLDSEVHEKRFREDLFYRINVVKIDVPPLRDRHGDVLALAQHFIERSSTNGTRTIKGLSALAAEKLLAYEWPGNVRELENCLESAVALARFDEISVDDLPAKVRQFRSQRVLVAADSAEDLVTLKELEQRYLRRVLPLVGGNKTRAAKVLGVDRRTLYRMLERLDRVP